LEVVTLDGAPWAEYAYDANGNRLSRDHAWPGLDAEGDYDVQDRLKSYGAWEYSWSDAGDLLARSDDGWVTQTDYEYDETGALLRVARPGEPGPDHERLPTGPNAVQRRPSTFYGRRQARA
jgi:YD repeat-containing protein